jgi:hypothetical protein
MWQWKAPVDTGNRSTTFLENNIEVLLVNAQHIKHVPGRKTDVKDSEWIAELRRHGLLKASFIPPVGQRELRELTRHRTNFVRERATLVNRVQKTLESANFKLASVATNVMVVSGHDPGRSRRCPYAGYYLSAQYHRLAGCRGKKIAIFAVARSILVIAYHLIQRKEPYHELGGDYFDKRRPEATAKRLLKRLERLGYDISLINQPTVLLTAA